MNNSDKNPVDNESTNNNSDTLMEFDQLQKTSKIIDDLIVYMNNKMCNIDESKLNSLQKEEYRIVVFWLIFRKTQKKVYRTNYFS